MGSATYVGGMGTWARPLTALAASVLLVGCTTGAPVDRRSIGPSRVPAGAEPTARPQATMSGALMRGTLVRRVVCPKTAADWLLLPTYRAALKPISGVTSITLCGRPGAPTPVTVHLGDPRFATTVALLSRPDQSVPTPTPTPGIAVVCLTSGLMRILVLATANGGTYLVSLPVVTRGCDVSYLLPLPPPLDS